MSEEITYTKLIDASTGEATPVTLPVERTTKEVVNMILGDEDITVGRMPVGGSGDESDFDLIPRNEHEMLNDVSDEDLLAGDEPKAFDAQLEYFPRFRNALRKYKAMESPGRVARIDTEETFGHFVSDKTVKELGHRIDELREALEEHASDEHGHPMKKMRKWDDIIGAAHGVSKLKRSATADEALNELQIPLDLPPFAEGKVKCWLSGNEVICSVRFKTAKGAKRIATMAARPKVDADDVASAALSSGVDPVVVLGALPHLATVACGNRLVKDCAAAAIDASKREDVLGMGEGDEPVLLARGADEGSAPLAALMDVQQQADAGDPQAQMEMTIIKKAATVSPLGQKVAAPVLMEAKKRLHIGRREKAKKRSIFKRALSWYADAAGWA